MLMLDDVAEKRRVEAGMRNLPRLRQENMEPMGRIVNLEPDEVQDPVHDNSGLPRDAGTIEEVARRDRRIVDPFHRTVHTLEGNSGRSRFEGLRNPGVEIPTHIARLPRGDDRAEDGGEGEAFGIRLPPAVAIPSMRSSREDEV